MAVTVLLFAVLSVLPAVCFWALLHVVDIGDWVGERWEEMRPVTVPRSRPIERLAADLRRLAGQVDTPSNGSFASRSGVQRAYDEVLVEACAALEVEQRLAALGGFDREVERVRVESRLASAGLAVR